MLAGAQLSVHFGGLFFFLGLTAKVIDKTKTMSDVYGAFFDFSCMLKSKVRCLFIFIMQDALASKEKVVFFNSIELIYPLLIILYTILLSFTKTYLDAQ